MYCDYLFCLGSWLRCGVVVIVLLVLLVGCGGWVLLGVVLWLVCDLVFTWFWLLGVGGWAVAWFDFDCRFGLRVFAACGY